MMEKMISEFNEGDRISGQFLIANSNNGVNASGSAYLNIELKDASGIINAKKWDVYPEDNNIYVTGNVVYIEADVLKYKDSLQLKVRTGSLVAFDEVDTTKFIKAPPTAKKELIDRFNKHVDSIKDTDCQKILQYMIKKYHDKLFDYPAATSNHHDYGSGLLMHTVSMADIGAFLADYYSDINRDILLTGILLHDMGKCEELEGPVVFKYSLQGKLLGHISIMAAEIRKAAEQLNIQNETPILLEHMILSHHGQKEFGSPVLPLTKEALLLSMIDNLDSKMVMLDKALETTEEGEFTQKIFPLDNRMFYKPKK